MPHPTRSSRPSRRRPRCRRCPAVNPTGGASLERSARGPHRAGAAGRDEKPAEASTADADAAPADTGATGETGATPGEEDGGPVPAEDPAPVTGSAASTQPQTGGAAVPVTRAPAKAAGRDGRDRQPGATGNSGATATGSSAASLATAVP